LFRKWIIFVGAHHTPFGLFPDIFFSTSPIKSQNKIGEMPVILECWLFFFWNDIYLALILAQHASLPEWPQRIIFYTNHWFSCKVKKSSYYEILETTFLFVHIEPPSYYFVTNNFFYLTCMILLVLWNFLLLK